jgi:hypothetical protein
MNPIAEDCAKIAETITDDPYFTFLDDEAAYRGGIAIATKIREKYGAEERIAAAEADTQSNQERIPLVGVQEPRIDVSSSGASGLDRLLRWPLFRARDKNTGWRHK